MRKLAVLAVFVGALGSVANAESAVNEAPGLAVAIEPAVSVSAPAVGNGDVASKAEQEAINKAMERVSDKLSREFTEKLNQELDYAMQ